jgi:hypothetical protein
MKKNYQNQSVLGLNRLCDSSLHVTGDGIVKVRRIHIKRRKPISDRPRR